MRRVKINLFATINLCTHVGLIIIRVFCNCLTHAFLANDILVNYWVLLRFSLKSLTFLKNHVLETHLGSCCGGMGEGTRGGRTGIGVPFRRTLPTPATPRTPALSTSAILKNKKSVSLIIYYQVFCINISHGWFEWRRSCTV